MRFESNRLLLKTISLEHAAEVFSYRSDPITNRYQGWIPTSLDEVKEFITNKACGAFNTSNTWHQMIIINKENKKLIGDIGIHFIDEEQKQVEIGCTLSKGQQGKGFAHEALSTVISILFSEFNKHRIIASIDPRNTSSKKMVEKLGFRKEAHFKKSLLVNGKWLDDSVYAILQEEWK